jgi:hypothetical protein
MTVFWGKDCDWSTMNNEERRKGNNNEGGNDVVAGSQ